MEIAPASSNTRITITRSVRFDDWVWNPNTLELRNGSQVITLEPRVARLFEYMVAHPEQLLSRDQLVEGVWEGRVVSDEAVRRAVFNLRQAFAGGSDSYIRTVHKKGYVATFPKPVVVEQEVVEEPTAAATNGTPSLAVTATTTSEIPLRTNPPLAGTARRWPVVFGVLAAIALIAVLLAPFKMPRESMPERGAAVPKLPATIAVLPFISLSEAADNQLLADGLTEELFGTLERNRELRVTARSSAFRFKEAERDPRALGERLGVRYVLEGDVRRNAQNVLVRAKLIDSGTGAQLWEQTYDRKLNDGLALQQDIVVDVARALQRILQGDTVSIAPPNRIVNEEAQLELLRARQLLLTRSVADAEQAIEHLQRALTLDPNYALAYARLADAILIQAESTTGVKAARPVVAPVLEKALALDASLGEAYALRSMLTDDAAAAERDLRRGLELNPSYARGYEMLASLQSSQQRIELALDSIDRAIALDPLSPGNIHAKATLMVWQGKWPETIELERRVIEMNPNFRAALVQLSWMSGVEGNFADAIGYGEQAVALDPRAVTVRDNLILMYYAVGDMDSARAANAPGTVFGHLVTSPAAGDLKQISEMLYSGQFGPPAQLPSQAVSQIVLAQALVDKNFSRARALLPTDTESLPPLLRGWNLYAYVNLVQLLDASGETAAALRLQELIYERMASHEAEYPRYAILYDQQRAPLLAHAGKSKEACAALARTYARAPRALWRLVLDNPGFDGMRTAPCFTALRTRFDAYVAGERTRIDEMRRAGQIPDRLHASAESAASGGS